MHLKMPSLLLITLLKIHCLLNYSYRTTARYSTYNNGVSSTHNSLSQGWFSWLLNLNPCYKTNQSNKKLQWEQWNVKYMEMQYRKHMVGHSYINNWHNRVIIGSLTTMAGRLIVILFGPQAHLFPLIMSSSICF